MGADRRSVQAETFVRRRRDTASCPVYLKCSDGNTYVVKAKRRGFDQRRMMFNDQVVARFGKLLGAAVPDVAMIQISAELIAANPDVNNGMGDIDAGLAHGSLLIPNVGERLNNLTHISDDDNKTRLAELAMLHAWMGCNDRQFIYENAAEFRVFSHDHGHFFPGGPNWTMAGLQNGPPATVAPDIVTTCALNANDLSDACAPLREIELEEIATIIGLPPDDWGVSLDERVALAKYLESRQTALATAYPARAALAVEERP